MHSILNIYAFGAYACQINGETPFGVTVRGGVAGEERLVTPQDAK